jgi:hypothetical protein
MGFKQRDVLRQSHRKKDNPSPVAAVESKFLFERTHSRASRQSNDDATAAEDKERLFRQETNLT